MRIRYEDSTHTYWIDGVRVPSITQALKVAMFDEFEFVSERLLKQRAAEGTELARMIEDFAKGSFDVEKYNPALLEDFDLFAEWHLNARGKILESEKIVASKRWGFAGRLDLVYDLPGIGPAMIDIKRTHAPPKSGGPQTAAQVEAYCETTGSDLKNMPRYLLHIRNGSCTLIPQRERSDLRTFLASLTVTKWRESNGKHWR